MKAQAAPDTMAYINSLSQEELEKLYAKLERKLHNIRTTYLHTVTKNLTRTTVRAIAIEDLNVDDMMRNEDLAPYIKAQEFDRFRQFIEYKCKKYGVELTIVDRYFPSSKKCSCCGYVVPFLSLSTRTYQCPACGFEADRDLNAAINLENWVPA